MPTRAFPMTSIQTAVQARLTGDATLRGMVRAIADVDTVAGVPLPYITYGAHTEQPFQTFGKRNSQGKFLLDIWAVSREQAYSVLAEVSRLLDNWQFSLSDYAGCFIPETSTVFPDEDTSDWHAPMSYLIYALEV